MARNCWQKSALLFALFALAALFGCGGDSNRDKGMKPTDKDGRSEDKVGKEEKNGETDSKDKPRTVLRQEDKNALPANAPVIQLTADEFYQAVKKDAKAAHAKFKGSVLEVTGEVVNIGPGVVDPNQGNIGLALEGTHRWVICHTQDPKPWTLVNRGQKVKIRAVCNQMEISSAILYNGVFVDLKPNPVPSVSAEQLAKEFSADKKAALAKYKNKYLVTSGEVVEQEKENVGVYLKGHGKLRIKGVNFDILQESAAKALKRGRKATFLGEVYDFSDKDDSVVLNPAKLIR